jgi:hypothetical protein
MKLRLRNNSIRLRLTQREVTRFAETGVVAEVIEFGAGEDERLMYSLESSRSEPSVRAAVEVRKITVFVPRSDADTWASTDQVGIEGGQALPNGGELQILIEKDFTCLEPRAGGDDEDTFPHPSQCSAA